MAMHESSANSALDNLIKGMAGVTINGEVEVGEEGAENLPEYACSYCGIHNPTCVVMCTSTKKWFCNGHAGATGSHIVHHLVRTHNRQVTLHSDSPLGQRQLQCRSCGCRNVFLLGYLATGEDDDDDDADSEPILICRYPCMNRNVRDWDTDKWEPIIQDFQFVPRIVKAPSPDEEAASRCVLPPDMLRLEALWERNPEATWHTLQTPDDQEEDEPIEPVKLAYESVQEYRDIFLRLVSLEDAHVCKLLESLEMKNINVRWSRRKDANYANFKIPSEYEDLGVRITPGEVLSIVIPGEDKTDPIECVVTNVPDDSSGEITALVKHGDGLPTQADYYRIKFQSNSTPFKRMEDALDAMSDESEIHQVILGMSHPTFSDDTYMHIDYSAPGMPRLNPSQNEAVGMALQRSLSMIQGPPGTGKTVTAATIVYHLSLMNNGPVLAVAPSNTAADELCLKLSNAESGLNVVRVCARSREYVDSPVEHLTLHYLVQNVEGETEFKELKFKRDFGKGLDRNEEKRFLYLRGQIESAILNNADVICATCVTAGASFMKYPYHAVLVDEATQAIEPECLIPLVQATNQVVLVGDHCQLGPVVTCRSASQAGLSQSLFERLVFAGNQPFRLQIQYRMHPALSLFPSSVFYENTLKNGVSVPHRTRSVAFPWPNPNKPTFFYSIVGREEIAGSGVSFLNRREAVAIADILTKLLREGVDPTSIGVITPYVGQRVFIEQYLGHQTRVSAQSYSQVEISSVDGFQGREKDYIILSCVRANKHSNIGFLNDPRRLNVALTRAKYGLIIIGNPHILCNKPMWNHLLHFYQSQHLLVEGALDSLRPLEINLPPAKPYTFRPRAVVTLSKN